MVEVGRNRITFIFTLIILPLFSSLNGQVALPQSSEPIQFNPSLTLNQIKFPLSFSQTASFNSTENLSSLNAIRQTSPLAKYSVTAHLPIFCKLEVLADTKTKIPVRVRLGSVNYVDGLENKGQGQEWIIANRKATQRQVSVPR